MVFVSISQAFLQYVSTLSPTEIIERIIAGKFTASALKYAYEKLKQKQLEGKYYFTPSPSEVQSVRQIENSDLYQRTHQLLGIHPLFKLLRLGMFVNSLGEQGRKDKIKEVKAKVYKKYSDDGLRVLALASTGELSYVLEHLSTYYQRTNCDRIKLCKTFDNILYKWKLITIFVKKDDNQKEIENKIEAMIKNDFPYFFVFSYGSASADAYSMIARLDNAGFFSKKDYLPQLRRKKEHEDYAWVFEHMKKDIFDLI